MDEKAIFSIERPHPSLLTYYLIKSLLSGPFILVTLPFYFFRYYTLRYEFDQEGIHQRYGILFRKEVNLTYTRIQDIHLTSGIIQRWMKLADIKIQTASATYGAEMTIEGLLEFQEVRDFLYSKMRGMRKNTSYTDSLARNDPIAAEDGQELTSILLDIRNDLRHARLALEKRTNTK